MHKVYTTKSLLLLTLVDGAVLKPREEGKWRERQQAQHGCRTWPFPGSMGCAVLCRWPHVLPKSHECHRVGILFLGDNKMQKCHPTGQVQENGLSGKLDCWRQAVWGLLALTLPSTLDADVVSLLLSPGACKQSCKCRSMVC